MGGTVTEAAFRLGPPCTAGRLLWEGGERAVWLSQTTDGKGSILASGTLPVACICPFKHSKPSELFPPLRAETHSVPGYPDTGCVT